MKIRDIYGNGRSCMVSICTAALCVAVTAAACIFPQIYDALTYAWPIQHPWQVMTGLFLHGSPDMSAAGTIGHLGFNLLLVLPFGMMIEKLIGSRKFLAVSGCFWLVNLVTFYLIAIFTAPEGETVHSAGISGVAFSYGTIGLYVLIMLIKTTGKAVFRQVSFYLLMNIAVIMLVMINPLVAGTASMIIHLAAVIAGAVSLCFIHKTIDLAVKN